jgi:hypothetical protein
MDTETKELITQMLQAPDLSLHRILTKRCINRADIAAPALRICFTLIRDALAHQNMWDNDWADDLMKMIADEWQKHND